MAKRDPGPAVDVQGNPATDPTSNVLALVEAVNQRQDDLREIADKCVRELMDERHTHTLDTLKERAEHFKELRLAESERLDAIRSVDVATVQRAAEVQAIAANALAKNVTDSAEAMRTQVAAAASAAAVALAATVAPLTEAIADLRRVQYEQAGQKGQAREAKGEHNQNQAAWLTGAVVFISAVTLLAPHIH